MRKHTIAKMTNRNIGLLALVIFAIGLGPTLSDAAFAQAYTSADDPHGPMQIYAWGAGMAIVGIMAGAGIFTTVRKG